ncbi:MAG: GAF domain-containing protein, partial [Phycisphaerae bacterium]|nr:GAF domain-containing protein [Phycisphaerae bacterium]
MAEQTDLRKLLVLRGPALEAEGVLDFLRQHFDVEVTQQLDDALEAMRERRFDAVLAETADFLPLERGIVTQQAAVVLETIGDGTCVIGPGGEMVWANRRLRDFPPSVLEPLKKLCVQAYEEFASAGRKTSDRGKRFSLMPEGGKYYEVICSPVRDRQGLLRQVAAVVVDATLQRRQQSKLNAIDRAGRELVRLDYEGISQRDASQRLQLLQEHIIRYSRDVLDYQHFALMLLDEGTNRLEIIISEGLDEDPNKYELFAGTEGNGISGYVAATGRSYICPDVRKDPRYLQGLSNARSSLTVPLRLHDKVVGVLNVESDAVGAFGEEDRQFAEIFGNYIALALNILNLLVFERHSTHTQVSGSVSAELAGPINDIITEAGELMEDYIGHDDLRKRLAAIIDRASEARDFIKALIEAPARGVTGRSASAKDPL